LSETTTTKEQANVPETKTKDQIETRVIDALVEFGEERENVGLDARFEDLEVDSLDLVELAQIVEDEYGVEIKDSDLDKVETVRDVVDLIAARSS
jgi:acyl carrier protein